MKTLIFMWIHHTNTHTHHIPYTHTFHIYHTIYIHNIYNTPHTNTPYTPHTHKHTQYITYHKYTHTYIHTHHTTYTSKLHTTYKHQTHTLYIHIHICTKYQWDSKCMCYYFLFVYMFIGFVVFVAWHPLALASQSSHFASASLLSDYSDCRHGAWRAPVTRIIFSCIAFLFLFLLSHLGYKGGAWPSKPLWCKVLTVSLS